MESNIFSESDWTNTGPFVLMDKPLNNKDILNNSGDLIYSFKVRQKYPKQGFRLETDFGYLSFSDTKPDVTEIFNAHDLKIGQLLLKEKRIFFLEFDAKNYLFGNLETEKLSIKDKDDIIHLSIEIKEGNKNSPYQPSYIFSLQGKIPIEFSILLVLFVAYFQKEFKSRMHPTEYTFKAKGNAGSLKFYDRYGNLYAKSSSSRFIGGLIAIYFLAFVGIIFYEFLNLQIILAIILFLTLGFSINLIGHISSRFSAESIILEESGETIAKFKYNPSMKRASFTTPSRNSSGRVEFKKEHHLDGLFRSGITTGGTIKNGLSESTDIIESDGNYFLNGVKGCFSIYYVGNDFIIQNNDNFDNYLSLILSTIILKKHIFEIDD